MNKSSKDTFNDKIESSIRQSAEKITPPPFYSVLGKIASDDSSETYNEIFSEQLPRKKNSALKIAGIAAVLVILLAVSSVAAVITMGGVSMEESQAADVSLEFSEEFSETSESQNNAAEDAVSDSDFACQSSDVCSSK